MTTCKTIVCIPDEETLTLRGSCSNIQNHTPSPEGYLGWHAWAERMIKTHVQKQCPTCLRWEIWEPKEQKSTKGAES